MHDTGDISPIRAVWAAGLDDVWVESTVFTENESFDGVRLWRGDGIAWEAFSLPPDLESGGFEMTGWGSTPWLVLDRTVYGIDGDAVAEGLNLDDVVGVDLTALTLCAADAATLWIVGEALDGDGGILLRGEDLSTWSVVDRFDRSDLDIHAVTCTADAVWAWSLRSGAPALVRLDGEVQVIDEGPSDDSWTSPLFMSRGAPLVVADDDIWFIATRDHENTSEIFEWELWHHDGLGSLRLDLHDVLPDSFEPQRLVPAPGGGVFVLDDLGTIARFTPDP